ncbi:hypothetical protein HHK36_022378 [Tetracentron sinense]|uniref:Uncharacterized protein n=1 Tax=Tetracentron sinense TaxID=13715 RepID=A0A835D688_TETSI|nr:hypothetical protein HHK36_022378 [Tetracentron sinense]
MDLRLYKTATSGNVDLFKKLAGENLNLLLNETPLENTVLHLAAKVGHEDLVKEGCEKCESLLAKTNSKGDTALHIAARSGHLSIVNFPVEKSISVSTSIDVERGNQTNIIPGIQNQGNNTVLHEALRYHHSKVAKVLMEKCPILWGVVNEAAGNGNTRTTLEIYPDVVDLIDNKGQNAIQVCIGNYKKDMQGYNQDVLNCFMSMVWHDDLLNQPDIDGNTPLHLAVVNRSPGMVSSMLKNRGRIDTVAMNKDNFTPLDLALSGINPIPEEVLFSFHAPKV